MRYNSSPVSEGRSRPSTRFGKELSRARQDDPELGERARLRIDLN